MQDSLPILDRIDYRTGCVPLTKLRPGNPYEKLAIIERNQRNDDDRQRLECQFTSSGTNGRIDLTITEDAA